MGDVGYDKSIGSENRSVVSATKLWGIVLGLVLLVGIGLLAMFFMGYGDGPRSRGGPSTDNTATRPAEP